MKSPTFLSRLLLVIPVSAGLTFFILGCKPFSNGTKDSSTSNFQDTELTGIQLGLANMELALTFDDGPSEFSLPLAKKLLAEKVPATFFWLGSLVERPSLAAIAKEISEMKFEDGTYAFHIGSHSYTHDHLPSVSYVDSVSRAHKALLPYLKGDYYFFRPPYGAWGGSEFSKVVNSKASLGLNKYIGPVWWNIGGILDLPYAADYACWPEKMDLASCGKGYIAEAKARKGGVVLAHDVYEETMKMFVGDSSYPGLISEFRKNGFKFVALDKNKSLIEKLSRITSPEFSIIDCKISSVTNDVVTGNVSADPNKVDTVKTCVDFWGQCNPSTSPNQDFTLKMKDTSIIKRHVIRSLGYKDGKYVASSACLVKE